MDQQISHFKIIEEIGSGGMGVVYRATDLRLRRKVALKVLPAGALAEPTIRERLVREAQTASSLNHPYIVTVFEIHSAGDRDFIAMEFVEGKSLDHVIGDDGLPVERALRYAVQIADGLSCAHEHGVIHRDLKPQNVMITPSDDVKILDFGLAKRFLPAGTVAESSSVQPALVTLTAPGVKVGTPAYMSPEQIESREVDARSDVFSFGCLLYEMLTGVSPFLRRNAILIFKAVLSDQPQPLRRIKPHLPAELERILSRALAKDPADRYPSMTEVLAELDALHVDQIGTGVLPNRSGVVPAPPRPHSAAWRPAAWAALALAVTAAAWWLSRRPPAVPELTGHRLISSSEGFHRQADFSPGGDKIALAGGDWASGPQIWARTLADGESSPLTSLAFLGERPRWSADGRRVLFATLGGGIWSTAQDRDGAPERVLEIGASPALSLDGKRLVVEHDGRLWLAGADGSGLGPLVTVPPASFTRWVPRSPAFSPDGRRIAYFQPEVGALGGLWVVELDGGRPRRLFDQTFRGGDPAWTADGRWIVFSADLDDGAIDLWAVPARGGRPERLTRAAGRAFDPALSRDGRRLVYTLADPSFALKRRRQGDERPIHESRFEIVRPALSPDGGSVAFSAPAGPDVHLFTVDVDGGAPRQVTGGGGERNGLPRWSADGTHLYFYQQSPTRSLRKVPAAGGASTRVLADWSWARRYDTAVDPRERRVAYTPIENGELGRLRILNLEDGEERELPIVLEGARWSPDGGLILGYDSQDRIYLCPVSGDGCRFLADGFEPRWASDGASITFARRGPSAASRRIVTVSIWTLDLADSTGRKLADVEAHGRLAFGYGVLPDGTVIWNQVLPGREELWMADVE